MTKGEKMFTSRSNKFYMKPLHYKQHTNRDKFFKKTDGVKYPAPILTHIDKLNITTLELEDKKVFSFRDTIPAQLRGKMIFDFGKYQGEYMIQVLNNLPAGRNYFVWLLNNCSVPDIRRIIVSFLECVELE